MRCYGSTITCTRFPKVFLRENPRYFWDLTTRQNQIKVDTKSLEQVGFNPFYEKSRDMLFTTYIILLKTRNWKNHFVKCGISKKKTLSVFVWVTLFLTICLSLGLWTKRTEWCQSILTKGALFLASFIWVMFRAVVVHHTMKETTLKIQVPEFTRSLLNTEHYRLGFFVKCYMVLMIGIAWDVASSWTSRKIFLKHFIKFGVEHYDKYRMSGCPQGPIVLF